MGESHKNTASTPPGDTQKGGSAKLFGFYFLIYYPVLLFGGLALCAAWLFFWIWIFDGLPGQLGLALIMSFGVPAWFVWSFHKFKMERVEQAPVGQLRHFSAQRGKEKLDHDGMKIARYNYDAVCQILGSRGVRIDREPVDIVKELISQAIGKENMGVWEKPAALQGWSYYQWLDRDGNALIAAFCKGVTMDWWVEDKPV